MNLFPAGSQALHRRLPACATAAAMLVCIVAAAAGRPVAVVPAAAAASGAQPQRVSPYTLANRKRAAAASSPGGLPSVPPAMRRGGRQGLGRDLSPAAAATGS